jgi:hypothetical protein
MSSFSQDMETHDEQWEQDQQAPRRGQLPDGRHSVIITESRIEKDQSDNWTWVTKFQGKEGSIRKWNNLDHEVGRSIAAEDAGMMGYDGKLSGLEEWLEGEGPIDLVCEIAVKTKAGTDRDFTNVYLNRVMGKGTLDDFGGDRDVADASMASADDDIPF